MTNYLRTMEGDELRLPGRRRLCTGGATATELTGSITDTEERVLAVER